MKMTFRHYGDNDPVTLEKISQIPTVRSIVSTVYDVAPGGVWSRESIGSIKTKAAAHGLEFEVVESVPVSEDIKLGNENAAKHLDVYCENIRRLSEAGVKCICYNFMPVFDWFRSNLERVEADGSNSLAYDEAVVSTLDPLSGNFSLPGWDESYTKDGLRALLAKYDEMGEEGLWKNFQNFLEAVMPVAHECGVNMAIHPDDPPWGIFGLPRIISNEANYKRFLKMVDVKENGITFCTGSLGANPENDLVDMIHKFGDRIHFAHIRNVKHTAPRTFHETAHPTEYGSLDIYAILKALHEEGFDGYMRPDHGRMIWGETGRYGYGLYDRALGATYLSGLWEAIERSSK